MNTAESHKYWSKKVAEFKRSGKTKEEWCKRIITYIFFCPISTAYYTSDHYGRFLRYILFLL